MFISSRPCPFLLLTVCMRVVHANDAAKLLEATAAPSFDAFIEMHGRSYTVGSAEYRMRKELYAARVRQNEAHNLNPARTWTAGVNMMSDRTPSEIAEFNGYVKIGTGSLPGGATSLVENSAEADKHDLMRALPKHVDWLNVDIDGDGKPEDVAALHNIQSQTCGNCWAFATNTMLDAHRQLHGGVKATLNNKELTECSTNVFGCGGGGGCQGSTPELAIMHYAMNGLAEDPGLLRTNTDFQSCPSRHEPIQDVKERAPHEIKDGVRQVASDSPFRPFGLIGWEKLPVNQGLPMMLALLDRGPLAVSLSTDGWQQYASGVYGGCGKDSVVGHSVVMVGYGETKFNGETVKYWRLQNSWGPSFGENGHFRLLRHDHDSDYCGADHDPIAGVGCKGGPTSVKICGMCGILYDAIVPYFQPETWLAKQLEKQRNGRPNAVTEAGAHKRVGRNVQAQVLGVDEETPLSTPSAAGNDLSATSAPAAHNWTLAQKASAWALCIVLVLAGVCMSYRYTKGKRDAGRQVSYKASV